MQHIRGLKKLVYILLTVLTACACNEKSKKLNEQSQNEKISKSFPPPAGYVSDFDSLYSQTEKDSLEKIIANFEDSTTIQIALIIFKASMLEKDSIEAFTQKIGNAWGVGQKEDNKGVAIGICPECRKVTIQNGYGIEKILSDAETQTIIDKYFIPEFKEGKYFKGTIAGVQALIEILTKKFKAQKNGM